MPTVVLRDSHGADVGFVLVAGNEPLSVGPWQRDVVLMRLPLPSTSPLAEFISSYKHTEFSANVKATSAGFSLVFEVAPNLAVVAELTPSGAGTWSVSSLGSGTCQILAK